MNPEEVLDELQKRIERDAMLSQIRGRIESGKATDLDSARYCIRSGAVAGHYLGSQILDVPSDAREALCVDVLRGRYKDAVKQCAAVQEAQDAKQGLHLAAQIPAFNSERAHKIGRATADPTAPDETIRRRADAPIANATASVHDDFVRKQADFRSGAGLSCQITRDSGSGCCPWCAEIAGRYAYGSEPKDIYARHDNCGCTVTFESGRKRSGGRSGRQIEHPAPDAGAGVPTVFTAETRPAGAAAPTRISAERAREIAEQQLLIPAESGISGKHRTRTSENAVDLNMLHSDAYKAKFNGITGNPAVDRQLYAQAVAQLTHRNGTYMEDMVLIDSTTGEIAGRQTHSKTDSGVDYNRSLINAIASHPPRTLISMHNHPTNYPPTGSDLASARKRGYALGVVVTHDGRVFTYKTGESFILAELFDATVDKYRGMGYNWTEAIIKALDEYSQTHDIEWSER